MHAFLRRFLMHYGIYRRYPLGLLPALRNEPRRNYRRGAPTRTERGKISEAPGTFVAGLCQRLVSTPSKSRCRGSQANRV
jgi:hypothetical protein